MPDILTFIIFVILGMLTALSFLLMNTLRFIQSYRRISQKVFEEYVDNVPESIKWMILIGGLKISEEDFQPVSNWKAILNLTLAILGFCIYVANLGAAIIDSYRRNLLVHMVGALIGVLLLLYALRLYQAYIKKFLNYIKDDVNQENQN